jgi:hypothetical protein
MVGNGHGGSSSATNHCRVHQPAIAVDQIEKHATMNFTDALLTWLKLSSNSHSIKFAFYIGMTERIVGLGVDIRSFPAS